MSRGLGRIQEGCLVAIWQYEREGKLPTTYNITAEVYHVARDDDGNRLVSDAQHVAVKRALEGLQRQGKVIGFRTDSARDPGYDARTELCHHWMSERRANQWLAEQRKEINGRAPIHGGSHRPEFLEYVGKRIARVEQKMKAIGMKLDEAPTEQTGTQSV
jgi:hypothetical protein